MTERERLIKELRKYHRGKCDPEYCDFDELHIADFILADRRRVLEEVEKPLKDLKESMTCVTYGNNPEQNDWNCALAHYDTKIKAISEALAKIEELKGGK